MGRKSVRDMGPVERWTHSLTVRSTIGVQLLALAVGAIVLFAGFMLYYKGIIYEYKVETSQMAKAESVMLDPEKTRVKTDEILSIYDSVPDSEKGDFHRSIWRSMHRFRTNNSGTSREGCCT